MFIDLGENSFFAGLAVPPHFSFAWSTNNQKDADSTSVMAKIESAWKEHSNILSVFIPFHAFQISCAWAPLPLVWIEGRSPREWLS